MKVLIDCAALGSGIGGDETWLTGLIEGLADVADTQNSDQFPLLVDSESRVPVVARGQTKFPTLAVQRTRGFRHFMFDLRKSAKDPDPADLLMTITHAPVRCVVPSALVIGDLSFRHLPHLYPSPVRQRLNWLVPRQARNARVVLTPSEFTRQDLIDSYDLDPDRVRVVPNRVTPPQTTAHAASEQDETRASDWARENGIDGPFVLYLGNVHPRKNLGRLVRAFLAARRTNEMSDAVLVIAGARWWESQEGQDAMVDAPRGSIIEVGRVDNNVRRWLLQHAVALAYPSLFEGFGLPPLEAMAHGTAVLASNCTSLPEVLGDAAHFVDPYDVESITSGLVTLWTNDTLRQTLRIAGTRRAAQFDCTRVGHAAIAAFGYAVHSEAVGTRS